MIRETGAKTKTIYAIQHTPTGRIYVGKTWRLDDRIKQHMNALKNGTHPNELMQSDYNESGTDYKIFVLEVVEDIYPLHRDAEWKWMDKLGTGDPRIGYNYNDPHYRTSGKTYEVTPGVPEPNAVDDNE